MDAFASLSNAQLVALVREQAQALQQANARITALEHEIARLKSGGTGGKADTPVPDWVRPNTQPQTDPPQPRKKRTRNFTFHRREPTQVIEHACACCPDCGRGLTGGWEYSRRQVVDIPPVAVQVSDHVVMARRCGVCQKIGVPAVDWKPVTGGSGHYGVRLQSLVAYLRTLGRLPLHTIQAVLASVFGLEVSVGEVTALLARVAQAGQTP